jgi:predicted metal-dependent hydrolase
MLTTNYNYQETLTASVRANWRIEEIIGGSKRLDFTKTFMPESLARVQSLSFLNEAEKILLNQIRGFGYLYTFGVVEEFILPFVLDHVRPHLNEDDYRTRALLQFASEEAKHIQLFKKFAEEFEAGFVTYVDTIGPPEEIGKAVLSHSPLGVALVILGIEWMTQQHYLESVRDNENLDPQFRSLLRHHWMEESQHTKLDTLMIQTLTDNLSAEEIEKGISDYAAIGALIDNGIQQQVRFDMQALQRAAGRDLSKAEEDQFRATQKQAVRWTYLRSAMKHPKFLETVGEISAGARTQIDEMSRAFS